MKLVVRQNYFKCLFIYIPMVSCAVDSLLINDVDNGESRKGSKKINCQRFR